MSVLSDDSDTDNSEKPDDKDVEFNIDDYRNEIDSDDSYDGDVPEVAKDTEEQQASNENDDKEETEENIGQVLPGGHRFDKKLVCVRYPGNVINPDKAVETLGGLASISSTVAKENRRLELRFRPGDGYGKPACGDRQKTTGFLLRVRIKKSRVTDIETATSNKKSVNKPESKDDSLMDISQTVSEISENQDATDIPQSAEQPTDVLVSELTKQVEECTVDNKEKATHSAETAQDLLDSVKCTDKSLPKAKKNMKPTFDRDKYEDLSQNETYQLPKLKVLGRVDTEFRFSTLCDFQYLPLTEKKSNPKELECIHDKLYPSDIPPLSWLKNDVPYFLPPAAFTRMDTMQQFVPKTETDSLPSNVIGRSKKRKAGFSNIVSFSAPDIPTDPPAGIETAMKVKFLQQVHCEQIREIFAERPIWSKNAIMYKSKFTSDQLKILLPSVAYYFMTGPWRTMWVKLGYDPRKDTSSRKYQTLDYRLRSLRGLGSSIQCKRNYSNYTLPYKSAPISKTKCAVLTANVNLEQSQKKERHLSENVFIFREGMIPPSRQMFYQYCDVLVDEVQEMLAKLPDPLPGVRCHEKRGWLPSGFDVQCREIINKAVRNVLRKKMNIPVDHPTSLPRKRRRHGRFKQSQRKKPKGEEKSATETTTVEPIESTSGLDKQEEDESSQNSLRDATSEHNSTESE